jgi:exosortase A-associated hydrolase 1
LDAAAERPLLFSCEGEQLLGVLHPAAGDAGVKSDWGVVVVVGGPQVRAGSHRLFVHLARALVAAGHPVLRFDVRGMGDSSGAQRTFEQISPDIGAAIDTLMAAQPQLRGVVLWGLCDGASAALLYLHAKPDSRVAGLVLLNPWVRSETTLARTTVKHYYWQRLRQPTFWRKLLGGGVALKAMRDLLGNLRATRQASRAPGEAGQGFQQRMLSAAEHFHGNTLWVLSGQDYTAKEFLEHAAADPRWQTVLARQTTQRLDVPTADHTFSASADANQLLQASVQWMRQRPPRQRP